MPVSDIARKNHDELFPGHVSRLAATDPELIEYFDNFAFDEVLRHGRLPIRTRLMVVLSSLIACQALDEYRVMLSAALTVGVSPVEIKEIVYQAVPYVGMGKVFDFLHATNDVLADRGVEMPLPGQSTTTTEDRAEKVLRCRRRSSARTQSTHCTRVRRRTRGTSSATCQRIASATTTPAPVWTSPHASC
jgi:4-carboxymuconolactone decarboxylase